MLASEEDRDLAVRVLLEHKADVDLQDEVSVLRQHDSPYHISFASVQWH